MKEPVRWPLDMHIVIIRCFRISVASGTVQPDAFSLPMMMPSFLTALRAFNTLVFGEEVLCVVFNCKHVIRAGPNFVAPPGSGEVLTGRPSGDDHQAPVRHIRLYAC